MSPLPTGNDRWLRLKAQRPSANDLLRAYGAYAPPVPIFDIARWLGVEVFVDADAPYEGRLRSEEGSAQVIVRGTAEDGPRERYTCAHEIGHLILHETGVEYRDRFPGRTSHISRKEAQANGYAAALLMPFWMLQPLAFGHDEGALARIFNVSRQAMRIRLAKMAGMDVSGANHMPPRPKT